MRRFPLALLVVLLVCLGASAQSRKATRSAEPTMVLTGVVYDINGSVITTGTVVVADSGGEIKYAAATDDEGVYKIDLPLGVYKIEAGANLFCPAQVERFIVVNSTHGKMSLDFVLEASGMREGCERESIVPEKLKRKAKKKPVIISE